MTHRNQIQRPTIAVLKQSLIITALAGAERPSEPSRHCKSAGWNVRALQGCFEQPERRSSMPHCAGGESKHAAGAA
jgi:hypothetical protein